MVVVAVGWFVVVKAAEGPGRPVVGRSVGRFFSFFSPLSFFFDPWI